MARGNESSAEIRNELGALLHSRSDDAVAAIVDRYRASELGRELNAKAAATLPVIAGEAIRVIQVRLEGDTWPPELPPLLTVSVQYMAQIGMSLDEVVRSYAVVGTALIEFIIEHLDELAEPEETMRYLANLRSANDDRMMAAFAAEYERELERLHSSPSRHLAERVQSLLDGGNGDFVDFGYRLDACHLGLIAMGAKADLACRRLAEVLGCELLLLPQPQENVWAWLGAPRPIAFADLEQAIASAAVTTAIATGEPRAGVDGWRLTHREARAAATVTLLGVAKLARYSDVALLVASLRSKTTGRALVDRYLTPLDAHRDSDVLRQTLRTYLDLDCNAASAAAALGVDRHTVKRRLGRIEKAAGESISARRAEIDVSLRLEELTAALARLTDGDSLDHLVPFQLPARTNVARPRPSRG